MGTPFDLFGPKSSYADPSITAEQRANRARLRAVMQRCGFAPIAQEWWHFTLRREPFPNSYFDFPVR
jgi:D-alanyl-D-alanine dipeptidase